MREIPSASRRMFFPLCVLHLGYPAEQKPASMQSIRAERVHWQKYDSEPADMTISHIYRLADRSAEQ